MKKPILLFWIPTSLSKEEIELTERSLRVIRTDLSDYHILPIMSSSIKDLAVELLGAKKLSKKNSQTIINAIKNQKQT